jgi:hypothetical protein
VDSNKSNLFGTKEVSNPNSNFTLFGVLKKNTSRNLPIYHRNPIISFIPRNIVSGSFIERLLHVVKEQIIWIFKSQNQVLAHTETGLLARLKILKFLFT